MEVDDGTSTEKDSRVTDGKSFYNMWEDGSSQADCTIFNRTMSVEDAQDSVVTGEMRHFAVISMELTTLTTKAYPDSHIDPIIALSFYSNREMCVSPSAEDHVVFIVADDIPPSTKHLVDEETLFILPTEKELIRVVMDYVEQWDPDVLISYENERLGWGYLMKRAEMLHMHPITKLSRIPPRAVLCDYLRRLSAVNVKLLWEMNTFPKTAEMARVYGIQFEEVYTRGSQFRVESMLLRLAKKLRLFAPSIAPDQRNRMCAPEQLQLVMEPRSGVYFDPIIVLDFQSLYPSMAIAYNYCYTTCLGKIAHLPALMDEDVREVELGALPYHVPIHPLIRMTAQKSVHVSPLGAAYVKWEEREGLVPLMLREILAARIMVKQAAKKVTNKRLARVLDARQLALKLVANVTYGYTAANWSGRMPCVEVADAILGKGRETLERAIRMVNTGGKKYKNAKVISGDTDSMFVIVKGATVAEAFEIGRRIADDVTADNPAPVVLKLEKVYKGCVLQTKKRYAGLMCESEADEKNGGKFDAKGIETVRRDTCPVVATVLERSLRLLFSRNFRGLRHFLDRKLSSIDTLPYTDFLFCKEYRGDYSPVARVPQAKVALEASSRCAQAMPLRGERVPYLVVRGQPTDTVYSCVRSIDAFIANPRDIIHYDYYVKAHILAALHRVLNLLPTKIIWLPYPATQCANPLCGAACMRGGVCGECKKSCEALACLASAAARDARRVALARKICRLCIRGGEMTDSMTCRTTSCPIQKSTVAMRRRRASKMLRKHPVVTYGRMDDVQEGWPPDIEEIL